ncbi:MAG: hypothetical protein ABI469_09715, partial [Gemmatimonadales bacterium]
MRYVAIVAAVLVALVLIVLVVGWSLPVKHRATADVTVKAAPGELYRLISDVDRLPEWRSSVKSIERVPDSAGKKRFREVGSNGSILYEIQDAVP